MPSQELAQEEQDAQTQQRDNDDQFESFYNDPIVFDSVLWSVRFVSFLSSCLLFIVAITHIFRSNAVGVIVAVIAAPFIAREWNRIQRRLRNNSFLYSTRKQIRIIRRQMDAFRQQLPSFLSDKIAAPAA